MKTITMTRAAALVLLLGFAAAPAAAQNREHQQMAAELRILQEQAQQLALTLAQLGEAVKALNARLDASDKALVKGFADHRLVLDGVARELKTVREVSQDTNSQIRRVGEELDALRTSMPSLLTQVGPAAAPATPADPNASPGTPPPAVAPTAPSTVGLSPARMYDAAFADYGAGQYALAIYGFEQFLKTFPQSERADDAQFLIGESHFLQNRFDDAVTAYNQVIQNYARGDQVAMAYFKRGAAQQRLGDVEGARQSWETVTKTYPDSDAAGLARQRLDSLSRDQAPRRSP